MYVHFILLNCVYWVICFSGNAMSVRRCLVENLGWSDMQILFTSSYDLQNVTYVERFTAPQETWMHTNDIHIMEQMSLMSSPTLIKYLTFKYPLKWIHEYHICKTDNNLLLQSSIALHVIVVHKVSVMYFDRVCTLMYLNVCSCYYFSGNVDIVRRRTPTDHG